MQDLNDVMPRELLSDLEQNACGSIFVNAISKLTVTAWICDSEADSDHDGPRLAEALHLA